jgi:branched-subunit amino acid transport protein AzlD
VIDDGYASAALLAMGGITFALRALPFFAAQWLKKHPVVQRLGRFLPLAIMTLLVVHSMAGAAAGDAKGPWLELLAVAVVAALQWWRGNPLLSMLCGTAIYVVLRNGLF